MAWRRVKSTEYYFKTINLRTGKTRLYIGAGENGRRVEAADQLFSEQCRELRAGIMEQKEAFRSVGRQLKELFAESQRLTTAALLASGYYRNSNTWRRRSPELRLRVCK